MTLPVSIPNTFANATTSIPLANLDANFTTIYAAVNGIGNGSETLANVQVSGGTLSNVTLDNVTVDVETLSNVTLVDVTVTSGNATFTTANATTIDTTNIEVTNIKAKDGTASVSIADTTGIPTISKATVIETTDNTNAALRITQLGTGNALLVEDSANPDATPFVIDASGVAIAGYTSSIQVGDVVPLLQTHVAGSSGVVATRWTNSGFGPFFNLGKSRGTAVGTNAIVQSGDVLGSIQFCGDDGTDLVTAAAQIIALVDGTPGTNDMPGRLVFSTTADGASSPTERMRIDNAGRVGIGTISTNSSLTVSRALTGGTAQRGVAVNPQIQSDATGNVRYFLTSASTQAASFTVSELTHYFASQGTLGASSAITNQYGFVTDASLTGATNNYGFYSNIASGTGRWNFYANGTADNYFAGNVGIGTSSPSFKLDVSGGTIQNAGTNGLLRLMNGNTSGGVKIGAYTSAGNANGYLAFEGYDAEYARFTSDKYLRMASGSGGIQFNGDTAAANALDDYEEGTWTPSLGGNTTYLAQSGKYIKIGRMVYVEGRVHVNVIGTGSTSEISGLPFTSDSQPTGVRGTLSVNAFYSVANNIIYPAMYLNGSATTAQFQAIAAAGTSVSTIGIFGNSTDIYFSGCYYAAT